MLLPSLQDVQFRVCATSGDVCYFRHYKTYSFVFVLLPVMCATSVITRRTVSCFPGSTVNVLTFKLYIFPPKKHLQKYVQY